MTFPRGAARLRPRTVLLAALVASSALHVAASLWPVPMPDAAPALEPLAATLTEMPAPPPAVVATSEPKPKPKRKPSRAVARPPLPAPAPAPPEVTQLAVAEAPTQDERTSAPPDAAEPAPRRSDPSPVQDAPSIPVAAEAPPPAPEPSRFAPKNLPPRIDLVYRGFLGTRGFFVGEAVYRLEHASNQYTISTVGEARGLAALFFRGQGRITSRGRITPQGLQPTLYSVERTSTNHAESATFDWQTGVVLMKDDKTAPLELPTYDPMAMMWQFYFSPPEQDVVQFNIATTRRLYHYSFRRVGVEKVMLSFGEVETHVWRREAGDGNIDATVWLAPSLHYVAAKLRLSNDRYTVEALLDSIRVDDTVAQQ